MPLQIQSDAATGDTPANSSGMAVGVIGGGIVGLAHAWSAAKRGHRVTVFERSPVACGASVRNFGMVWPIGQPAGEAHDVALQSRLAWLELAREAGVWVDPCGSMHLAHRADEWAVLEEFESHAVELDYPCLLLTPEEVSLRSPAANPANLLGGLYSPTELCVNPRTASRAIAQWLAQQFDVTFHFSTTITAVDSDRVQSSDGQNWHFDRAIICGGSDFETLFPDVLATAGLKRCKLQMFKTVSQPDGWRLGTHLASGLTLRHYSNFSICSSLEALRNRIADETPELDKYGIHVMASQNDAGEIILGDSHEYDSAIEPFDKTEIDNLMLRELQKLIRLPDWTLSERWHGIYAKHPSQPCLRLQPLPNVWICTATGGSGMTMSMGLAEQTLAQVFSTPDIETPSGNLR